MCQLRVRVLLADNDEDLLLDEVTHITCDAGNVTISRLFEPDRELSGFEIKEIDCMQSRVLVTPRASSSGRG
ncbi:MULTISPECIES: CooT family nickel-binding protein [Enterobacteriaceae]|uniref:CooT family nickel-binding protein n=1 Tax=Enterobacteriaceae TaxID=543 RepID=UPI00024F1E71|nr:MULTISPECIES: CooT family nickel-binding protein [Enterobacteriaceae]EFC6552366.1 CooT family nickel-binding protein [Escherichia coli]EBB7791856.1 CooT family nickel-binding protein [Salmonella enterica subsp. enterica serovar Senftenberg]EBF7042223.1 CooT family nickel-binding protein [Salmonella enterica subsp. enterica serovar Senftenberg]EFL7416972.1 CooT family nickel-binding protein [Escherichia coli]EFN4126693.1 CooT family nickel-binding protein [Escherichia coli]